MNYLTARFSNIVSQLKQGFRVFGLQNEIQPFDPEHAAARGKGFHYRGHEFVHHTDLEHHETAFHQLTQHQWGLMLVVLGMLFLGLVWNWHFVITGIIAVITLMYFVALVFGYYLVYRSLKQNPELSITDTEIAFVSDSEWPTYTIFCPLYKEWQVIPQFVQAIQALEYPKDKLQVLLLLEEDDHQTIQKVREFTLPGYFQVLIVPHSLPKTKPKACNFGLLHATGEYAVIYDAEDMPDALQLKKAVLAFQKSDDRIVCVQAKLNYYNPHQNLLTRLFTSEYSLWFDLILPGLQSINAPIPLGGTSNHFRTADLRKLKGWDAFNVTEDCDLGLRLVKKGYRTALLDSVTWEEANSRTGNWYRQRTRWIKGYLQTYLVHMRNPRELWQAWHEPHLLTFQLIVIGIFSMIINPLMWLTTAAYFLFRPTLGPVIESFYPAPLLYLGVFSAIFGNFMYFYFYMIGCAKRGLDHLIKFTFFIPFYWLAMSLAAWRSAYELVVNPHYWAKTLHGLHLPSVEEPSPSIADGALTLSPGLSLLSGIRSKLAFGGPLVLASIIGNFSNFFYNAYLVRNVSFADFGLISTIGSVFYLAQIPLGALGKTVVYHSGYWLGRFGSYHPRILGQVGKPALAIAVMLSSLWILYTPALADLFHSESWLPFLIYTPTLIFSTAMVIAGGFLNGNLRLSVVACLLVLEALSKVLITIALVEAHYPNLVLAAIPVSTALSAIVGWLVVSKMRKAPEANKPDQMPSGGDVSFSWSFFGSAALEKLSLMAFLSLDVILAKHYLSPQAAGEYALLALVGKMVFFVGSLFTQFINPVISHRLGAGRSTNTAFYSLLLASAVSSAGAFLGLGILGSWLVPLLLGERAIAIVPQLPVYTVGMVWFTVANSIVQYRQLRREYLFAALSGLAALAQVIGIANYHANVTNVAFVTSFVSIAYLVVVAVSAWLYPQWQIFKRNLKDLIELWHPLPPQTTSSPRKFNIVIFNWRDTHHVWAGGAEVYVHEIAKRWVVEGHQVTLLCGNDGLCLAQEIVDGVHVLRRGGFYTVYLWACLYYLRHLRHQTDVIIDIENGIPFFTPLYARIPVIGVLFHVHQEVYLKHLQLSWYLKPVALFAKWLEAWLMPRVYQDIQMVTISESSRHDMVKLGLGTTHPIELVYCATEVPKKITIKKTTYPSIFYLGRLQAYKSVDTVIKAMPILLQQIPELKFFVAGDGEQRVQLRQLVKRLKLEQAVTFLGKISEQLKERLLASSWVLVQPSSFEGWGLTVLEANAWGTPVVAANVSGLRDAVHNPHTGFLVPHGDSQAFASRLALMLTDHRLRQELSRESRRWAKQFSWDNSANKFEEIIAATINTHRESGETDSSLL